MSTVTRLLPWRRHQSTPTDELFQVLSSYRRRHPKANTALMAKAYEVARVAHLNQTRKSGEGYINHPLAVAKIVADIGLDDTTIAAALLHDAVEDTEITVADVDREFGSEVAAIVDGVTKLERIQFDSKEAQQAATMRKMLVAMAKDLRVLIIKLADRLHNMRTIASMPVEKQQRIANETLEIYAPLAHRLGMQGLKQQLEDLAFASLYPKRYAELDHLVTTRSPERDIYLAKAMADVRSQLADLNITADVTGRGKHLWSIYEKMIQKGKEFDEIFDIVAIRVVVDSVKDCYAALGCIHGRWKPVVGRFKDHVAMPKFNLYQSLHTTVIGPGGKPLEIQIRTREMHQRAEWGVAAHWAYKAGDETPDIDWLNRIIDWQSEIADPAQFMESLKTDLDQDEIFVFTPKGRVIALPLGACPVDFAYSVHTEIGNTCIGARVNGRLVPLTHELKSGDTCEIFTSKVDTAAPSKDWLDFVSSPKARNKIRQWYSRERRDDLIEVGREAFENEFRLERLPITHVMESEFFLEEAVAHGYADVESLLAAVGDGQLGAKAISQRVAHRFKSEGAEERLTMSVLHPEELRRGGTQTGVHVEGFDDVLVRLSKCCTPVPGDDIIGFLTRGRGVSVHRTDCANAASLAHDQSARLVDVEWDGSATGRVFRAGVEVVALDRSRLLRDVANALSEQHVNIVACSTHTGNDRIAKMRFEFELADPSHLDSVIRTIKKIDAVYDAYRVVQKTAAN
ncbi:MAG: GTP pyrophosphokinase [Acidimicrobiales bacterium mtb01]|nr:bifunctional (p)ppGpp synthetase/guanosine-3',5'-bis(diphosphate) 3'-pyrophosphohydrolase [Actinomycetota bacterium]TEX45197.1 MAG: GTP pyrophosphokinase [Acidimicrobiales bacterium mtb01]